MKKIIALFLVLLMLLSLCACGSPESKIVGSWEYEGFDEVSFEFFKDGTGNNPVEYGAFTWEFYGDEIIVVTFSINGDVRQFQYNSEEDVLESSYGTLYRIK